MIEKQNIAVVSAEDDESEKDLDETIFRNGISSNDTLRIALSGFSNDHFPISPSLSFEPGNKFLASDIRKATDNFSARNELGRGGQATVYKGSLFGSMVAIKKYTNIDFSMDLEKKALQKVRHRNVILLMGYCPEENCIISEFLEGGSLRDKLEKKSAERSWAERYRITQEMVSAVYFIHSCDVLHRDLKPGNIMFDSHGSVKVADMGIAKFSTATVTATGNLGTPGYMDPHVYFTGQTSRSLDVYALGLIILQLCTHTSNIQAIHEIFKRIPAGERRKSPHGIRLFMPAMVQSDSSLPSEKAALLLEIGLECVELDPTNRPTLEALIERLGKETIPETIQQPLASSVGNGLETLLDRAQRGDPHDQFELGLCYEKGSGGVDKDEVQALYWYDMAARQGLVDASNALWILCIEEILTKLVIEKKDQTRGVLLLKQSSERNIACASLCLGMCFHSGDGVAQDPQMVESLYSKAASQGHAMAQLVLGTLYQEGVGVVKDEDKARELWARALEWSTGAAAKGYLMAMNIFSFAFENGYGVNKDSVIEKEWLSDYDTHLDRHRSLYG